MSAAAWLEAAGRQAVRALLDRAWRPGDLRCRKRIAGATPIRIERLEGRLLLSVAPAAFLPQTTFPTSTNPFDIVAADVNGDGKLDLIVSNYQSSNVSVLLGNGDGTFRAQVTFATGADPDSVALADVNRDGKADLIVGNLLDNSISVLLGNGDGTFQSQQTFTSGFAPRTVAAGDVNGDGKPDLIALNLNSGSASVLLGNGDGTFQNQLTFGTGMYSNGIALSDVNGDGKLDLVVSSGAADGGSVLLGNGDGTFQSLTTFAAGSDAYFVTAADVNGDGRPDLLVANFQGSSVSVLLGNGDGTFEPQATFATGTSPTSVAAADVNEDGKVDLLVTNEADSTVSLLLGNGDGTFAPQITFATGRQPKTVAAADVNGDGRPDLLVTNEYVNDVGVLLGDVPPAVLSINRSSPAGSITTASSVTFAVAFSKAVTGVDASDFSVATTGTVTAGAPVVSGSGAAYTVTISGISGAGNLGLNLLDNGSIKDSLGVPLRNASFQNQAAYGTYSTPEAVVVTDINGDGKPDLAVGNSSQISDFLGIGDGTFQSPQANSIGYFNPVALTTADVNGDGKPDAIAVGAGSPYSAAVLVGDDVSTFGSTSLFSAGPSPTSVAAADLNSDGKPDVIVADPSTNTVGVGLNDGFGDFPTLATFAAGLGCDSAVVADVNGNGKPDLVAANKSANSLSVLLGNGDGTFQPQFTFATGAAPVSVAVADLNGDGKLDLVSANAGNNTVSVLSGLGNGLFQSQVTFATGSAPSSVSVADMNGDGKLDLVVANRNSSSISILLGNGNGTFKPQMTFATGFNPSAIALADVNRDGSPDVISANAGSNDVTELAGNAAATFVGQTYMLPSLHFDFGTPTSPVAAGYTRVSDTTTYSGVSGYGWQTAPLGSRDRGTSDPLTRDFVYTGSGGSTFAANLPNGTYSVTVELGDATTKRDNQGIFFEGSSSAAANVTTGAGQVYTNTFKVTVGDGQLNLLLKDLGGSDPYSTIDSLDIAPLAPTHFDFGPVTSPVAAGYTRASETTLFSTSTGYGWLAAPAGSRDRGTSDPLTRDFVYANSTGSTFAVNIANGTYSVTVKLGDATTKRDDQGVFFEGSSTAAANVTTNAGQVYTNTFNVTVSDGQLDLTLKDLGGADPYATIDGLDIAPAVPTHFDFGPVTSPVAAGYTRASETTLFSTSTGFGWLAAPVGSRDRGAISGTTALTEDFDYTGSAGSTFEVNLPNGSYNVTVTMGDATTKRDDQGVYLEGALKDTVTTNANQYFIKTYAVTVVNGQLTLLLKDLGGSDPYSVINGLDIVAA